METSSNQTNNSKESKGLRADRALGGIIILGVGAVLLAKQLGADFPHWLFRWPMILIVIGIYVGVRQSFKNPGWLIPVAIGTVFILDDYLYDIHLKKFIWPGILIAIGLYMIFRSKRGSSSFCTEDGMRVVQGSEDVVDSVTIFGGVKKNIISKSFRGGEVVTVFGGTELNLQQADAQQRVMLEVVQVFGGTKLVIPPQWKVQTEELVTIFGGLNDKRPLPAPNVTEESRVIILKGVCIFGGIDIKSY